MLKRIGMVVACWMALTLGALPLSEAQSKSPTAAEIIAQIQQHVDIPWMKDTVDTFKAGDPNTRVTGNCDHDDGHAGCLAARGGESSKT